MNGPTGSGKTTTLYAAIREMDREALNIVTVEDPIEYEMEDISQVAIDIAEKVTFAKALRSVLRHDPDVVMVGEIRDLETADVAIKAAPHRAPGLQHVAHQLGPRRGDATDRHGRAGVSGGRHAAA